MMASLTTFRLRQCITLLAVVHLGNINATAQRPNIIYIMTDDMGYGDLSAYGRKDYQTANLDKLVSQGIKFVNAYAAAPVCTPTRTAFMTGRYPAKTPVGLLEPLTHSKRDSTYGLTSEYPSVAMLMKAGGYETALIGKWHLGFLPQHRPTKNGFEYFFGFLDGAADYLSHKGISGTQDLFENDKPVNPQGYLTDLFAQKAVAFIKQQHHKPFFLTVTFNAPHWPWQGPMDAPFPDSPNWAKGGSSGTYATMMKSLDDGIGDIMKALDDAQLSSNTILIFTNDNGGEKFSDNGGLAMAKFKLWEGGIRVPAFVRWPGKIKAGLVTQQVAVTMDWSATILSAGGVKANKDFPLDGIDLMPILTLNKKNIERTIYWRTFQRDKQKAIRMGDWKYLQDEKGEYLFNLAIDQNERNNLRENNREIFIELKKKYVAWEKTMLPPVPL